MSAEKLPEAFRQQLAVLRQEYGDLVPLKVKEISSAWESLAPHEMDCEALSTLHRQVHTLAGSGATFGFATLGRTARRLEELLDEVITSGVPPDPTGREEIARCVASLGDIAAQLPDEDGCGVPSPEFAPPPEDARRAGRLVFIVDDDLMVTQELALQLGHYGYQVRTFPDPSALQAAIREARPAAVLMDVIFPSGLRAGTEAVRGLRLSWKESIPVIFMSARDDIEARVEGVRAGGDGYLSKPIDVNLLVEKLESFEHQAAAGPCRVLVATRDSEQAKTYATELREVGMLPTALDDPARLIAVLSEAHPDLILLDLDLPGFYGPEVAAAIRQNPACPDVPILFLSTETAIDKQLSVLEAGADDFLTEPLARGLLVMAVRTHVERFRLRRSRRVDDGVTSLLNHSAINERLAHEVARAAREKGKLACAIVDIDHFTAINESCGYEAGDRVLQALANMLRMRLRSAGVVGRHGGGKFMAVLPGANGGTAARLMDELRKSFSQLRHDLKGRRLPISFSCGVAEFPRYGEPISLADAADKALSQAKSQGRDRTILSGGTGTSPQKIMVIDDEPKVLKLMEVLLKENGYDVLTAGNGLQAYEVIAKQRPDAVILDVLLPGLNGFDLCRKLKSDSDLARIPVILMTGVYKKSRYKSEAQVAGAEALIEKPILPGDFLYLLRNVLEGMPPELTLGQAPRRLEEVSDGLKRGPSGTTSPNGRREVVGFPRTSAPSKRVPSHRYASG
jgi:diguanylate cyclase (GGDEF)-like protein